MSRACFETRSNGFANVIQDFSFRASLRNAAKNEKTLRNEHAGLVGLQRHEQLHTCILQHLASDNESQTSERRSPAPLSNAL